MATENTPNKKSLRIWEKNSFEEKRLKKLDFRLRPQNTPTGIAQGIMRDTKLFFDNIKNVVKDEDREATLKKTKQFLAKLEDKLSKISYFAERDMSTKLLNKMTHKSRSEELFKSDFDFCILVIDVNNLKEINDAYGHDLGDQYLLCLSKSIKSFAPIYKITAGRYGGDEFCLMIPLYPTIKDKNKYVVDFVEALRDKFRNSWKKQKLVETDASFAIGWVIRSEFDESNSFESMFRSADKNMYLDKEKYRESIKGYA